MSVVIPLLFDYITGVLFLKVSVQFIYIPGDVYVRKNIRHGIETIFFNNMFLNFPPTAFTFVIKVLFILIVRNTIEGPGREACEDAAQ